MSDCPAGPICRTHSPIYDNDGSATKTITSALPTWGAGLPTRRAAGAVNMLYGLHGLCFRTFSCTRYPLSAFLFLSHPLLRRPLFSLDFSHSFRSHLLYMPLLPFFFSHQSTHMFFLSATSRLQIPDERPAFAALFIETANRKKTKTRKRKEKKTQTRFSYSYFYYFLSSHATLLSSLLCLRGSEQMYKENGVEMRATLLGWHGLLALFYPACMTA